MTANPTAERSDLKGVLEDVAATHAEMQRNVRSTPTSSDLKRLLDDVAVAHATMQHEALLLRKERHMCTHVRSIMGWIGVALCATYAAASLTTSEPHSILVNGIAAVAWGVTAVLNFLRHR